MNKIFKFSVACFIIIIIMCISSIIVFACHKQRSENEERYCTEEKCGWDKDNCPIVKKSPIPIVEATIDINPDTLNLKSKGSKNSITTYITLPESYSVENIQVETITLVVNNEIINTQLQPISIEDSTLIIKFDRQDIISALNGVTSENVSMLINGELNNGYKLEGTDIVKIINK